MELLNALGILCAQKQPINSGILSVKNHLLINNNKIMPPIADGWFLTRVNETFNFRRSLIKKISSYFSLDQGLFLLCHNIYGLQDEIQYK